MTNERRAHLSISEAADYLNTTQRWLRRAVFERRVAYHKLGRLLRFDPDDLDRYLEANRVEPQPDVSAWRGAGRG